MTIENNIERIADALEALVAQREQIATIVVPLDAVPGVDDADQPPASRGKAVPPTQLGEQGEVHPLGLGEATVPATDKTGRPWDERIDSSNQKMTAKGVWQARRNVPDETRASVLAEIALPDGQQGIDTAANQPLATTQTSALVLCMYKTSTAVGALRRMVL